MKRREVIKSLAFLPLAGNLLPFGSVPADNQNENDLSSSFNLPPDASLHRKAFVMDGHVHVMSRELLEGKDIGQRYSNGSVDLPRAIEGGLDAMFFSVYTPEPYYPDRHEIKNTFRVVELALDQIEKNNNVNIDLKNNDFTTTN